MESLLTSFRNFSNSASKSISFFLKRSRKFSHRSDISEPEVDLAFSNVRNTLCKENTMRSVPHQHLPPSFQSEICQQLRNQASNLTTGLPGCVFARRQSFTSLVPLRYSPGISRTNGIPVILNYFYFIFSRNWLVSLTVMIFSLFISSFRGSAFDKLTVKVLFPIGRGNCCIVDNYFILFTPVTDWLACHRALSFWVIL